mmetsp:Transcript_8256/g.14707  ORF Transcript_8256/g.14707 Transcript_8256/m.14707 type:complete len:394 (+) Transcript_8256:388-1569(+)
MDVATSSHGHVPSAHTTNSNYHDEELDAVNSGELVWENARGDDEEKHGMVEHTEEEQDQQRKGENTDNSAMAPVAASESVSTSPVSSAQTQTQTPTPTPLQHNNEKSPEVLKHELAVAEERVEALLKHHQKTRETYNQLATMYEQLRAEYSNSLRANEELHTTLKNERMALAENRSKVLILEQKVTALEQDKLAYEARRQQELEMVRQQSREESAQHVDPDDIDDSMLIPEEEMFAKKEREMKQEIVKLENEKGELQALLDDVEREMENEQAKVRIMDVERETLHKTINNMESELSDLRKRASRSIGVRELEELVATKVSLAEAAEDKLKLQHALKQVSKEKDALEAKLAAMAKEVAPPSSKDKSKALKKEKADKAEKAEKVPVEKPTDKPKE